ncbi:MAG: preprotein translocase subunit SecA [Fibrobacterales bacterium]
MKLLHNIIYKVLGTPSDRYIKKLKPVLEDIYTQFVKLDTLDDAELVARGMALKERARGGAALDEIQAEAYAIAREAADRRLGMFNVIHEKFEFDLSLLDDTLQNVVKEAREALENHTPEHEIFLPAAFYQRIREIYPESVKPFRMQSFEVQLIGGLALNDGNIAEMQTGEGKTLAATCPVYLNALTGKGVHVVTVNDYLASRDAELMGKAYHFLGLSVGLIVHGLNSQQRREGYGADVTYGTNNEFGFDYLRDNMATDPEDLVQRGFNYCIVDEIDSILVDEARTPLIISGPAEQSTEKYTRVNAVIPQLTRDKDFIVDEKSRNVLLTDSGVQLCEKILGVENLYGNMNAEWVHHISQALKAWFVFQNDVDYLVKDGQVVIVDENTGRLMEGRRYSEGLHQAIEAKEQVKIARENQTLAQITFQNFFRMYDKLSGMTGTAATEATEFMQIYSLGVITVPTHKPCVREDHNDKIFKTHEEKLAAIVSDIKERHEKGQPILVGTISVERSEELHKRLKREGVQHDVLNAKNHGREAEIILSAGQPGRVTIATNMAGRGTDIALGTGVKEVGGLYVLATERHESRRIDNQLRGRGGRQGDPGESCYYLSLDDNLMRIFGSDRIKSVMDRLGAEDGEVITHPFVNKAILNAQKRVEGQNFEGRKHLLEYDDVMNEQRKIVYGVRGRILKGENIQDEIFNNFEDAIDIKLSNYLGDSEFAENLDYDTIDADIRRSYGVEAKLNSKMVAAKGGAGVVEHVIDLAKEKHTKLLDMVDEENLHNLERRVLLLTIDQHYKEHLQQMDHLRDAIRFHGYAQKDPLMVYKKEGFTMFESCMESIATSSTERLCNVRVEEGPVPVPEPEVQKPQGIENREDIKESGEAFQRPAPQRRPQPKKTAPVRNTGPQVGRNDPCWCGSGKKFKKCHGA